VVLGRAIPPRWGICLRRLTVVRALRFEALLGLVILGLAGCGGASHSVRKPVPVAAKKPPVCMPAAAATVARAVGASAASVSARAGTGNNAEPQCVFAAAGKRVTVIVNLDSSPQPYARLERAIVELGQQFGTQRNFSPPETEPHLGLDAAWVPDTSQLLTTDGLRLITVTTDWPHTKPGPRRTLARRMAQLYLLPLHRQAGEQTEL
jgi:hypothetical protein